jgi:hypothetical protein
MSEVADTVEVIEEPPSLRDSIADAFDKVEPEAPSTAAPAEPATTAAPSPEAPPADVAAVPTPPASPEQPPVTATPQELKAPAQWKPQVREKWNTLPREVQEEVLRREGDSMRLIGSVGPKIRLADEVNSHIADFLPRLQEAGVPPSAFIGDIFTSVKSLASGSPQERAEVVANIVQSYGVDLRTLDAILTQRIQAGPNDAAARQAMAKAQVIINQQKQGIQHQTELETEKTLAAFAADPKHEFLDDVRELMADLIEAGRAQNLEDAYAAAIWAHADTRKILLQREAQTRAAAKGQRAVAARRASAAVHGAPSTTGNPVNPNLSLRDTIAAALDEQSSP